MMVIHKLFLGMLLVLMLQDAEGSTIHLSASTGSDAYTPEQAGNPMTPWKTLDKLNNSMDQIHPGDSILFKRGDHFTGRILLSCSGTSESPVVFGAYDSGPAPVISGAVPIDQWVNIGGNIWEADCPVRDLLVTNLMINGKSQQIGRYPNGDAANSGYLTIESHGGNQSITSSALSTAPDLTGGDAMIRTYLWLIDRSQILQHTGNTINVASPAYGSIRTNFGFFIQNHINTLDQSGEWYFDDTRKKIYLFYFSDPNVLKTEATSFSSCFEADDVQHIIIEDMAFDGSSLQGVFLQSSDHLVFRRNTISNSGNDGVIFIKCEDVHVENNRILNSNNNALIVLNCQDVDVKDNEVISTGFRAGMGAHVYHDPMIGLLLEYTGIFLEGNSMVCESNHLDSTGFNGIYFMGDFISVVRNHIDHFCGTLEDGGGIYTYNEKLASHTDRRIEKNIILNAIGAQHGTSNPASFSHANGIYLDYGSDHVTVTGNTVANCVNYGIYNSHAHHNSFIANTLYNNDKQLVLNEDERDHIVPVTNCEVRENIFYSRTKDQHLIQIQSLRRGDITRFGTFDWNFYCRPVNDFEAIRMVYMEDNTTSFVQELLDLKSWQIKFEKDQHSIGSPYQLPIFSINGLESNRFTNGDFDTGIFPWGCWSPYSNCRLSWEDSEIMDGGCMKAEFTTPSGESYGRMFITNFTGNVVSGENYVMKFSLAASQDERVIQILMRRGVAPYDYIDTDKKFIAGSGREEHEILFVPDLSDDNARIDFLITEDNTNYRFDNLGFYKADIELTNSEDSIRFIYNPGPAAVQYNDGYYYMDARGVRFHNFALPPYSSLILIKISELYYNVNDPAAQQTFLKVFPNPAHDVIHVVTNEDMENQLSIYDLSGKRVFSQVFCNNPGTVDVSFLEKGVYLIKIINDQGAMSAKFIML
ncbi:MAG: right-handed parallel beta-helix repeat-containing protein [Bacteroidota bacterium]